MNPLKKARYRTAESLRTARDGTTRTVGWVAGGVARAPRKARDGIKNIVEGSPNHEATARPDAGNASTVAADGIVDGIRGSAQRLRENPRVAIAWAAVAVLVVAWIAWTVYVWIENGSTAGVGVLISWPAAIAALALIASPFVAATLLVKRLSADGGPQMAGAAGIADAPAEGQSAVGAPAEADDEAEQKDDDADEDDDDAGDDPAGEADTKDDAAA